MEPALALAVVILVVALVLVLAWRRPGPGGALEALQDLGALKSKVESIASTQESLRNSLSSLQTALGSIETSVVRETGTVKESLMRDFQEARRVLESLKTELDARKELERELRASTHRIEMVIAGTSARGRAGESVLAEALKKFPANMVETNFRVRGHVVEYALVLADGRRVPIDSKWTSPELLERLEGEPDAEQREALVQQIEEVLKAKAREVSRYVDPAVTVTFAVAAVPDAVFALCRRAHFEAFKDKVVLMPYSLTIVYLLSLYYLHLEYYRSVDMARLEVYLEELDRGLNRLEGELENRVSRGITMVQNALSEMRQVIGDMRGKAAYLRSLQGGDGERQPQVEGERKEGGAL